LGKSRAKEVLKQTLDDKSPRIKRQAAEAPAFLRDISAVEPLLKYMRNEDKEIRRMAANDLGYLGGCSKKAEALIQAALGNVEDDILEEAKHALETIEQEKKREALHAEIWEI
jgi:hypothetical protein